jgi:CheY-like chemotaxis protein
MKNRVLVVEDEPLLLMMAAEVVEDAGFEALEAGNADEALSLLETVEDIRILLTDIDMPGSMDGLTLASTVRDRWPPIEIVVVSGKQRPRKAELPERSVFFPKPYDIHKLSSILGKMAAWARCHGFAVAELSFGTC